jgi:hypothetical protein
MPLILATIAFLLWAISETLKGIHEQLKIMNKETNTGSPTSSPDEGKIKLVYTIPNTPCEQYQCQSYMEGGKVIDCTCGKCS